MTGCDFAAWCSEIVALDAGGTDDQMREALTAFAAECGVELSESDIVEWFRLDETPKAVAL